MNYDHWKTTDPSAEYLEDNKQNAFGVVFGCKQALARTLARLENPKIPHCEHCNKPIHGEHITIERSSGPSTHELHFHNQCWRCPACGTNGPHYCPADIARD